jgi:hypothetical protein
VKEKQRRQSENVHTSIAYPTRINLNEKDAGILRGEKLRLTFVLGQWYWNVSFVIERKDRCLHSFILGLAWPQLRRIGGSIGVFVLKNAEDHRSCDSITMHHIKATLGWNFCFDRIGVRWINGSNQFRIRCNRETIGQGICQTGVTRGHKSLLIVKNQIHRLTIDRLRSLSLALGEECEF